MKRVFKHLVNAIAVTLICVCSLGLFGCQDVKKLEVKITADGTNQVMTVDLYRHLAPKTVDKVIEYVNAGYYNDALFYKMDGYSSQIMVGDLKLVDGQIVKNAKAQIYGEFENNGTTGSDLKNNKGYIGIWRSWYSADGSNGYTASTPARDSGSATWYIPTAEISAYNGNFCVFAKYDANSSDNSATLTTLNSVFESSEKYDNYVIYYTGEYDAEDDGSNNHGLTFHCVTEEAFAELSDSEKDAIFEADEKEQQLVCYNKTNVKIATGFARITSISLTK